MGPNVEKAVIAAVIVLVLVDLAAIIVSSLRIFTEGRDVKGPNSPSTSMMMDSLDSVYTNEITGARSLTMLPKQVEQGKGVKKPSLEFLSLLKSVAHFSGLNFLHGVKEQQRVSPIRNWAIAEGSERTLLYNEMEYEYGGIVVPATGLYFVYSHAKFYVEDNRRSDAPKAFNHILSRYNALQMNEDVVFSNTVSECKEGINDGAHLEYPSDIRGVVKLNVGDQLIVRVSNVSLLRHDRDWHYFGAYLI